MGKFIKYCLRFCIMSGLLSNPFSSFGMADGFVFLTDVDPTIIESPRYFTGQNFMHCPVEGYTSKRFVCTWEAADQLKLANDEFKKMGYQLVIYDAYRPQRAVEHFTQWAKDEKDQTAKHLYYPTIDKKDVFKLGYIAERSSHSRGSTFDLTLIKLGKSLKEINVIPRALANAEQILFLDDNTVDMGSSFDLFHEASHHNSYLIDEKALINRNFLQEVMKSKGFQAYDKEWWHYTLANEPFPHTYFDFVITEQENPF